jgi:hypothetical protein
MEVKSHDNENCAKLKRWKKTLADGKTSHVHGMAEIKL